MKYMVVVNRKFIVTVEAGSNGGAEHRILDNMDGIQGAQAFKMDELYTETFKWYASTCETISYDELTSKCKEYSDSCKKVADEKDLLKKMQEELDDMKKQVELMEQNVNIQSWNVKRAQMEVEQAKQKINLDI